MTEDTGVLLRHDFDQGGTLTVAANIVLSIFDPKLFSSNQT